VDDHRLQGKSEATPTPEPQCQHTHKALPVSSISTTDVLPPLSQTLIPCTVCHTAPSRLAEIQAVLAEKETQLILLSQRHTGIIHPPPMPGPNCSRHRDLLHPTTGRSQVATGLQQAP